MIFFLQNFICPERPRIPFMKIYEANLAHRRTKILPRTIDPHFRNIAGSPLNLYTIFHFAKPRSRYNSKHSNHLKRFISWSKKIHGNGRRNKTRANILPCFSPVRTGKNTRVGLNYQVSVWVSGQQFQNLWHYVLLVKLCQCIFHWCRIII